MGFRAETDHEIDVPGGWVEEQLSALIRARTDLHSRGLHTLLDYFISDSKGFISISEKDWVEQPGRLLRWFGILQRAGINFRNYMQHEGEFHAGGELKEDLYHVYQEYPVFTVKNESSANTIAYTRGLVVTEHADTICMPGTWQPDIELDICQKRELKVRMRKIEGEPGLASSSGIRHCDRSVYWTSKLSGRRQNNRLGARRREKWQDVPTLKISTAGFDHGDYSVETALTFIRDIARYPLYMEHASGWLYYPKVVKAN